MKFFSLLTIILLIFQSCQRIENKKLEYHSLKKPLSSVISARDTQFYDKEFLQALDTMKFEGKDLPVKFSLMEYYGGTFYEVSHIKFLITLYPEMGRVYFLKFENDSWTLKWVRETSVKTLDSIQVAIISSIHEDKRELSRDASEYRISDLARFTIKNGESETDSIEKITLDKPGYILLNTLMDIKSQ